MRQGPLLIALPAVTPHCHTHTVQWHTQLVSLENILQKAVEVISLGVY